MLPNQSRLIIDNSAFASDLREYQVKVVLNPNNFNFHSHPDGLDLCFTDTSGNSCHTGLNRMTHQEKMQ